MQTPRSKTPEARPHLRHQKIHDESIHRLLGDGRRSQFGLPRLHVDVHLDEVHACIMYASGAGLSKPGLWAVPSAPSTTHDTLIFVHTGMHKVSAHQHACRVPYFVTPHAATRTPGASGIKSTALCRYSSDRYHCRLVRCGSPRPSGYVGARFGQVWEVWRVLKLISSLRTGGALSGHAMLLL